MKPRAHHGRHAIDTGWVLALAFASGLGMAAAVFIWGQSLEDDTATALTQQPAKAATVSNRALKRDREPLSSSHR